MCFVRSLSSFESLAHGCLGTPRTVPMRPHSAGKTVKRSDHGMVRCAHLVWLMIRSSWFRWHKQRLRGYVAHPRARSWPLRSDLTPKPRVSFFVPSHLPRSVPSAA